MSITVPNPTKPKGQSVVPGTSSDLVFMGGQHALSLIEQFDQVDNEFVADHVQLVVDSADERQFASNDEDAPTESSEEGPESESESNSESESEDGNAFPENDDLVDSSDSVSQVMAPSEMSSGVVTFKQNQNNYSNLHNDPAFVAYIKSLVSQEMEAEHANLKKGRKETTHNCRTKRRLSNDRDPDQDSEKQKRKRGNPGKLIKSPSDTTLYTPAFKWITNPTNSPVANLFGETSVNRDKNHTVPDDDLAGQIINYIEGIRLQTSGKPTEDGHSKQSDDMMAGRSAKEQDEFDKQVSDARRKGDKLVLDAKQFRATVNVPAGMALVNYQSPPLIWMISFST